MSDQNNQSQGEASKLRKPYKVYDRNQRGATPRIHEIIVKIFEDGRDPETKSYMLFSDEDKPCEMPQEHAYKFLTDPAFRVVNPEGVHIPSVKKFDPSAPITALKDDEVIVNYNELSRDALFKRVKLLPGSEVVPENAKVGELADFMVKWRKSLAGMTEGDRAMAEAIAKSGLDRVSQAGLDKMFGERQAA